MVEDAEPMPFAGTAGGATTDLAFLRDSSRRAAAPAAHTADSPAEFELEPAGVVDPVLERPATGVVGVCAAGFEPDSEDVGAFGSVRAVVFGPA